MINWNFNPYALSLIGTGVFSMVVAIQVFLRWKNRESLLLGFAMVLIAEWSFFVGFESAVQDQILKVLFAKFSYFGVFNCLPLFFLFVTRYFRIGPQMTRTQLALLWAVPICVILLAATNDYHHLIWSGFVTPPDSPYDTLVYLRGPLYWLGLIYNYLILLVMSVIITRQYLATRLSIHKSQSLIFVLSILPPLLANILYVLRIPLIKNLDITPIGFFLSGLLVFVALNKYRLLEIAPIARSMLFDNLAESLVVVDGQNAIVDINRSGQQLLRYPQENWMGINLEEGLINIPGLQYKMSMKTGFHLESTLESSQTLEIDGQLITDENRGFAGWLLAIRDITSRKKTEKVEIERRLFAEALRDVSMAVNSTLNLNEVLERILSSVFEFLPCNMANILLIENGVAHVEIFHGYISPEEIDWVKAAKFKVEEVENLKKMYETGQPMFIPDTRKVDYFTNPNVLSYLGAPIRVKNKVIGFLNLDSNKANVFNSNEEADRLIAFADLAGIAIDNARMYQKMEENAIIDSLTGINNRRSLLQAAEKEFERSRRHNTPISIIMLDIDNFKMINDTCGHQAGDSVLADVGKVLAAFIRKIDTAGRYGGDEFCILLPDTTLIEAQAAAIRLLDEFHQIKVPGVSHDNYLQASLGVAWKDENIATLEDLLVRADQAMYQAKKRGRNRVEVL